MGASSSTSDGGGAGGMGGASGLSDDDIVEIVRAVEGRLAGLDLRANVRDILTAVQAG
eukprot:CAMPEP_0203820258 /NCGR_PEP_ID=MMETSP0115-20131106/39140_1 /ASSEMBLY_ACC=CAM_ASM_000227 /TAXON_ID=33651 /ORGANISM="Bicosoecid sp, Strain ms1" /LENGTH=57 /DNA_ID=CAMNT_0050729265 /DNA_START=359 /DNA_END=528 /DNA_ORIENTATION=-